MEPEMVETLNPAQREITDHAGRGWVAVPVETLVAHLKAGAVLGFRPAGEAEAEPLRTAVQFNSLAAAEFAIRTMGDKELRRRLEWAKTDAGIA
jgi:hypothetical protein